jgi:hypothetical protein
MWPDEELRLVSYLLGQAPPELVDEIEERIVMDDGAREELLATADDLIHAYLSGDLSREDRERFEAHFLSRPRHRQRLSYMRDLLAAVERESANGEARRAFPERQPGRSLGVWAVAAALVIAVVGGLLWLVARPGGETEVKIARGPEITPSTASSPGATPPPPTTQPREARDVPVVRVPREPGAPVTVALAHGTRAVRLEVAVDDEHPSFDVVLRRADGTNVWRAEGLVPSGMGKPLVVELPARILTTGAYVLRVAGEALRGETAGEVREHPLRVVQER